uniref:Vitelline membrane outer layer protein 1-like n=1 Tax=Sinocyclocheilus anshuiensis TaxID=1608454 RepID=A0A671PAD6_9TELE
LNTPAFKFLVFITGLQVSVESTGTRSERSIDRNYRSELTVPNGGRWGSWGHREMCPTGTYAAGFSLKTRIEMPQGRGDDTALNDVRIAVWKISVIQDRVWISDTLVHMYDNGNQAHTHIYARTHILIVVIFLNIHIGSCLTSDYFDWMSRTSCMLLYVSVLYKYYPFSLSLLCLLDQSIHFISICCHIQISSRFICSQGHLLLGDGTHWGDWGDWSQTCQGKGICGIKTRIEMPQGRGDDTALNDVRMFCCN